MIEKMKLIAREAGEIILKYYKGDYEVNTKKHDQDFLTTADLESEKHLKKRLKEEFPAYQIFSEETVQKVDWDGKVWVVDPIDGTWQFVHHGDRFAVIIGLAENGIPTKGVIYFPVFKEMFFAEKGKGAFVEKNEQITKLGVSNVSEIKDSNYMLCAKTINIKLPGTEHPSSNCIADHLRQFMMHEQDFNVCEATCGKWDTCGTQIILEEAGGKITDIEGSSLDYKTNTPHPTQAKPVLLSNGVIHDKVIKALDTGHD